ncbi:MAG: alpha/beta fold hydrolase [Aeromicrobium sp.]
MKVILVPGFWIGAWSWDRIVPVLEAAGHDVTALTLPGVESLDADRSGIGLADHVAAVVAAVDAAGEPVVLVGHSGGGAAVHGAVDQRPDRVARAVYVDSAPLAHGDSINAASPTSGARSRSRRSSCSARTATAPSTTSPTRSSTTSGPGRSPFRSASPGTHRC